MKKRIGAWAAAAMLGGSVVFPHFVGADVTAHKRDGIASVSGRIFKRDPNDGSNVFTSDATYFDIQGFNTLTPNTQNTSSSASGTFFDTATGTTPVVTGSGTCTLTSTLTYNGNTLTKFTSDGAYQSTFTTNDLSDYDPQGSPANFVSAHQAGAGYNDSVSFFVTAPTGFRATVTQTNAIGTAFNAAEIYLDVNDDGNFNTADGDIDIVPYFVIGGNDTMSMSGTLAASPFPYRLIFFGNTFDDTESNDTTLTSSATYHSELLLPEPTSVALALAAGFGTLLRRRRAGKKHM